MATGTDHATTTVTCDATIVSSDQHFCKYKGVRKRKWGKWVSEIRLPNSRERIWLGSYDSPEKAARAFDAALYCLRGRHANFNFPHTPLALDINVGGDQSLTPQEIQVVAARFANEEEGEEEDPSHDKESCNSQRGEPSSTSNYNTNINSNKKNDNDTSPSSCLYDGHVQVDHGHEHEDTRSSMDWSFFNLLDSTSDQAVGSDNGPPLYSGLDKMHSGELLYPTSPPPPFLDVDGDENLIQPDDDQVFSHESFLWNF